MNLPRSQCRHPFSDSVNSIHYKLLPDYFQQTHKHETFRKNDDDRRNNNWCAGVTIGDRYEKQGPKFLKTLHEFRAMSNGHQGRRPTSRYQFELVFDTIWPVHSASYGAMPTSRQYSVREIDRILNEKIIRPATAKSESKIIFTPERQFDQLFCRLPKAERRNHQRL